MDIGCGSGLNSLGAWQAGARRLHSFDYDENSVLATKFVRNKAGNPANWVAERGDVLDDAYMARLGRWNFVYSWGVLHHTGDVWRAIANAQQTVADGGVFYLALYASDVQTQMDYWLAIKREYNEAGSVKQRRMVWDYIWNHMIYHDLSRLPDLANRIMTHKLTRGMSLLSDIRDWLGGWPMQFTAAAAWSTSSHTFVRRNSEKSSEEEHLAVMREGLEDLLPKISRGRRVVVFADIPKWRIEDSVACVLALITLPRRLCEANLSSIPRATFDQFEMPSHDVLRLAAAKPA